MTADQQATAQDRFHEIYDSLYDDLFRYLARRVRRVEDADDLLAEVFTVVWQRLPAVPRAPDTRPWVFAVARNHVRNHTRGSNRSDQLQHRLFSEALTGPREPALTPSRITSSGSAPRWTACASRMPRSCG